MNALLLPAHARRLKLFLHVSSCYANGNQKQGSVVEERLYPLALNGKRAEHEVRPPAASA